MNNALLYLGGLLVVVLAALFSVPFFIDWNGYRGVFEEEASKVLGRDVRVGGAVNLRLLPTPYVRFEKVRLADTTGQTGEPFVRAESFTMWLAGPALLRGVLEANEVELNRPVLSLVIDDQGSGNWSTLHLKTGALPFVPKNVALRSVKLIEGTVAIYGAQSAVISRIESINGELSADALAGPYKYKGAAKWSGEDHEIKFATTEPASDGSYRIKANVRSLVSQSNYTFDGGLADLSGKPKYDGDLTAKFTLPPVDGEKQAPAATEGNGIDLKAKVTGNSQGVKLDDINISFDNAAEPQLLTGTAASTWGAAEPRMETVLSAKWLDLDRLAGAGEGGASFQRIEQIGLGFIRSLAGNGAASAKVTIDQVKIGGETAGGLNIDAERSGGVVTLKDLRAGLPGGSRLNISGQLKDDNGSDNFDGQVLVHGGNLARFIGWAAKSGSVIDIKADGPFSVEGRLIAGDKRFEFTQAKAEISGQPLSGEVRFSDDGRRRVAIAIEAARVDTALLFPTKAAEIENEIRMALGLQHGATAEPTKDAPSATTDPSDVSLRLLASELKTGTQTFRNVDATLAFEAGEFRVPRAKFTAASGLGVVFEARVKNAAHEPKGTLAYEFNAQSPDAMKDMAAMTGVSDVFNIERLQALQPARLAGLVRLGERGKGAADVTFGGVVKGARVSGRAELDGGLARWRTAPSRITANGVAPDLAAVLVAFGADTSQPSATAARPATFSFASSGTIATGAKTVADIKSPGLETDFNGNSVWPEAAKLSLNGNVTIKARDFAEVLSLAGVAIPGGLAATALEGVIAVADKDGLLTLTSRQMTAGAVKLRGQVSIKHPPAGNAIVTADIVAGQLKVASLLAVVLDKPAVVAAAAPSAHILATAWPEQQFNFDALKSVEGDIKLGFSSLELEPGLATRAGAMKINFKPGKISVSGLSAEALGGKLDAATELEKTPGGVTMSATLKIAGAALEMLNQKSKGRAGLDLAVTGRAQSPATLIAQLTGQGAASLEAASHPGPNTFDVAVTSAAILGGKLPNEPEIIRDELVAALTNSQVQSGTRTMQVSVVDGAARIAPFEIDSKDGKTVVTTTADLSSLAVDSAWAVAALVPPPPIVPGTVSDWSPAPKGPLAPVSVVYVGRLADLAHLDVKVDPTELQRELTVRQMERNVEELERLRRRDEDRVKRELDRRKAFEAERAAAAAAKAPPAAPALPPAAATPAPLPPAAEKLPPVLPESNGTATNNAAPADGSSGAAVQYNTQAGAPDGSTGTTPPVQTQTQSETSTQTPTGAASSATVSKQQIEIIPDVPLAGTDNRSPVPRPAAASRPPAGRSRQSRTSSDEMLRSLGGTP